ncbi:MAG: circadian clock KaiB family protein [Candidatus Competibacteraceae bacterium]|jgi:circadian clock protein KaiB|nr:circadian clock KaiB family protein [Candidatus Competibacteraceae bacterium]
MSNGQTYLFKLYIAGETAASSMHAVANFQRISDTYFPDNYHLEVIDICKEPERAIADRIIATPTLVKDFPPPRFKIVGDLSQRFEQVRELFGFARKD